MNAPSVSPRVLPTTRPMATAAATGVSRAASMEAASRTMPALARAKIGSTTKLDHSCRPCSTRLRGEMASRDSQARRRHCAASASGSSGWSSVAAAIRTASALTAAGRWNGRTGVTKPRATPAIVAWTPDSKVANQTIRPRTM